MRVSLWSRGVDRDRFDPARRDMRMAAGHGMADDEVAMLFFGRLVLEEGRRRSLSRPCFACWRSGVTVRPLVVGEGPARGEFEALAGAVLTGHLDGADLARAVASADILLHPSRTEAFGNVVLEAMASGLAVVAADADSARQLIKDGRSGLLYAAGEQSSAANAIARLVGDADERRAIGAEARAGSARFDWHSASQSVVDAYRNVLARSR